jgi:hypothetical protein
MHLCVTPVTGCATTEVRAHLVTKMLCGLRAMRGSGWMYRKNTISQANYLVACIGVQLLM